MLNRHSSNGQLLALALVAMFALMIPVIYVANVNKEIKNSNAAGFRFTVPRNEPRYLLDDSTKTPTPTVKPGSNVPRYSY